MIRALIRCVLRKTSFDSLTKAFSGRCAAKRRHRDQSFLDHVRFSDGRFRTAFPRSRRRPSSARHRLRTGRRPSLLVPMCRRFGLPHRSLRRRISIATSAPFPGPLICVSDQPGAVSLLNGLIEFTCQFRSRGKRIVLDRSAQISKKLYGILSDCCLRRQASRKGWEIQQRTHMSRRLVF